MKKMTSTHMSFLELETNPCLTKLFFQRKQPQVRIHFPEAVATPWSQPVCQAPCLKIKVVFDACGHINAKRIFSGETRHKHHPH